VRHICLTGASVPIWRKCSIPTSPPTLVLPKTQASQLPPPQTPPAGVITTGVAPAKSQQKINSHWRKCSPPKTLIIKRKRLWDHLLPVLVLPVCNRILFPSESSSLKIKILRRVSTFCQCVAAGLAAY